MLGMASGLSSLARFIGPLFTGFLYDLAQSRGAFFGGAIVTFFALLVALSMRNLPLTVIGEPPAAI